VTSRLWLWQPGRPKSDQDEIPPSALRTRKSTIILTACDCTFEIQCPDDETTAIVATAFSGLLVQSRACAPFPFKRYDVSRCAPAGAYRVIDSDGGEAIVESAGSLLVCLDKWITLALQHGRPGLYFLHAAAVATNGRVAALAAPSGTGKSTLALALLERRFTYLTDELTPVDPRAVCLKALPTERFGLRPDTLDAGSQFYVRLEPFRVAGRQPMPLAAVFFLERGRTNGPACHAVSTATAAAYLVANTLNSSAHPADGLDVALRLSSAVPCFALDSADLDEACSAVGVILSKNHA
jgi:hypothetical protein